MLSVGERLALRLARLPRLRLLYGGPLIMTLALPACDSIAHTVPFSRFRATVCAAMVETRGALCRIVAHSAAT